MRKKIIDDHMIEPVLRHGMKPKKWVVSSQEEEISSILELVEQLRKSRFSNDCFDHKDLVRAYEWRGLLENQGLACEVLTDESTSLQERLSICPLVQSKRDWNLMTVIVVDADEATYPGLLGRQQLFVAATRAMHALYFLQRE